MTPRAERVVLVVLDGLRPDMVDAARTPNLAAFARRSVRFSEARSVFPSMTRVATTATATGCWPQTHGVVGNSFHRPDLLKGEALDTARPGHMTLLQDEPGGVVNAQSLGERLAQAGLRMGVAHGGSAGSAFLLHHRVVENGGWTFSAHGAAGTRTPAASARAEAEIGPLPDDTVPKIDTVNYVADVAIRHGLAEDGPELLAVWLPEPDTAYHYCEIGSEASLEALAAADAAFGRIADAALSGARGARTAVVVMSDHGQITTTGRLELEAALRADGFPAAVAPGEADRIGLTLGRSGEIRLLADDAGLRTALVEWLMGRDEIGMIFARDALAPALDGVLPLSAAFLDHPRAADLFYVMRCDAGSDRWGLPGRGLVTGGPPVGGGMHGGLNRRELATVLMVAAPDGAAGVEDARPCGLIDIAPTALALLGRGAAGVDGAPLPLDGETVPTFETHTLEAARGAFRQRLTLRSAGAGPRLEEGGRA